MVLASREPGEAGRPPEPIGRILAAGAALWYPWVLVAPLIDRQVRRSRFQTWPDRVGVLGRHALLLLAFMAVHDAILAGTSALLYPEEARFSWRMPIRQAIPDTILYSAIAMGFTIAEARRRQTEMAERLRAEVAEARLDALRQQLNPHFLFNTLNHIVVRLRSGEIPQGLGMLLALSDLLRDVLRERAQLIPLRDETRVGERDLERAGARCG